jgi:hypothetical protein
VGLNWIERIALAGTNEFCLAEPDGFGVALDLSGRRVVVSSIDRFSSHVFVYTRKPNGGWEKVEIPAPDPTREFGFGYHLALEGDMLVVATAPGPTTAIYTFQFDAITGQWSLVDQIRNRPAHVLELHESTLVLGAQPLLVPGQTTHVYEFNQRWIETATFPHPASSIAIKDDMIAVSTAISIADPDELKVYARAGTTWVESQTITSPNELTPVTFLGEKLCAGERFNRTVDGRGAIHVFEKSNGLYAESRVLVPDSITPRGNFILLGHGQMDASGDTLVAGSYFGVFRGLTGGVFTFSDSQQCATLSSTPTRLSLSTGDHLTLNLDAGSDFAGLRFWLAGTLNGSSPGFKVGDVLVPLRRYGDLYYPLSIQRGTLDAEGRAILGVDVPPGLPWLNHRTLHHVFVVADQFGKIVHVSNVSLAGLVNVPLQ